MLSGSTPRAFLMACHRIGHHIEACLTDRGNCRGPDRLRRSRKREDSLRGPIVPLCIVKMGKQPGDGVDGSPDSRNPSSNSQGESS